MSQSLKEKCPECGSTNLVHDYDAGETSCGNCGLVIKDQEMDRGPEWRAFDQEQREKRARAGAPEILTIHDKGLSTIIGPENRDVFKRKIPASGLPQVYRMRKWQTRSRAHRAQDRNLATAMAELDRLSDKLTIRGQVEESAAVIYRKALNKHLVRGRSINAMVVASLYAACRQSGIPRRLNEFQAATLLKSEEKKQICKCYRLLLKALSLQMPVPNSLIFVSKIAEITHISGKSQQSAIEIIKQAGEERVRDGKNPLSIAAASLYLACEQNGEKKTQREIADAAGITEVTERNRIRELERRLGLESPNRKRGKGKIFESEKPLSFLLLNYFIFANII